jgi:hypothetical protein
MKSNDHEGSLQHSVWSLTSIVLQFFNGKGTSWDSVLFKSAVSILIPETLGI